MALLEDLGAVAGGFSQGLEARERLARAKEELDIQRGRLKLEERALKFREDEALARMQRLRDVQTGAAALIQALLPQAGPGAGVQWGVVPPGLGPQGPGVSEAGQAQAGLSGGPQAFQGGFGGQFPRQAQAQAEERARVLRAGAQLVRASDNPVQTHDYVMRYITARYPDLGDTVAQAVGRLTRGDRGGAALGPAVAGGGQRPLLQLPEVQGRAPGELPGYQEDVGQMRVLETRQAELERLLDSPDARLAAQSEQGKRVLDPLRQELQRITSRIDKIRERYQGGTGDRDAVAEELYNRAFRALSQQEKGLVNATLVERQARAQRPTQVDLALRAAQGDPRAQKALELLHPVSGFAIEFDKDGRVVSVEQGPGAGRTAIPQATRTAAWQTYQNTGMLLTQIGEVRRLLQEEPKAPGVAGKFRVLVENVKATISPKSDADTMVKKLATVDTATISQIDLYKTLLTAQVALLNNPDGRISNADWTAAAQALGFDKVLGTTVPIPTGTGVAPWKVGIPISSAADILPRLDVLEQMARAKREDAGAMIGAPKPAPGAGPPAPAAAPRPPLPGAPAAPPAVSDRTARFLRQVNPRNMTRLPDDALEGVPDDAWQTVPGLSEAQRVALRGRLNRRAREREVR